MKALISLLALTLTFGAFTVQAQNLEASAELTKKAVVIEAGDQRQFRFVSEVAGDSCNSIMTNPELNIVSNSKSVQVIDFELFLYSTVMGCPDHKVVMNFIASPWYRAKQMKKLIFLIPNDFEVEFK